MLKNLVPLFFLLFSFTAFSQSQTFTIAETSTFTVPAGVTTIKVEAWGAGAAGYDGSNIGGGGGAFAGINAITVTPLSTYTVTVGAGGLASTGGNGQASSFGALVIAAGANGRDGGTVAGSTGTILYAGGKGGTSILNGGAGGGGSAGAGGTGDVGGNTSDNSAGTAGGAGSAGSGSAGAAGGVGGNSANGTGSPGTLPGGGGGEGGRGGPNGRGGNGRVKISWITVSAASNPITVCSAASVNLTASALPLNPRGVLLAEGFNNPTNNWTTSNTSTGGTPVNAAWTLRPNNHQVAIPRNPAWNYSITFNSNDASQFYLSNSDSQGSAGTTRTLLTSPVMSTLGYSSLSLEFYHYYQYYTGSSAKVEVSTDGTLWAPIATYTTTLGNSSAFAHTTIILGAAYLGIPSLYIRFNYEAPWGYWWAIDNVTVSGTRTNYDYSWSASPSGTAGLPAGAGTPSTTNASITVNPTSTTIYTVTASTGDGLIGQSSTTVTVNPLPTSPTTTNALICSGSSATLAASGAIANQIYKWYDAETGGTLKNTSSTDTDNTYTTPAITATTDYWVSIVNSNGCESIRTKVTAFVNVNNIWNGSESTDWNTAGNWCIGVPDEDFPNTLDVVIPTGVTNYPIIFALDAPGYVETILFEDKTTLNVRENSLRVTLDLTLNGNSKIDFDGESQLLQDTGSTFSGTGTIEIDQQGTSDNFKYNYWGSPVNATGTTYTIAGVLRDGTNRTAINEFNLINFGTPYTYADGIAFVSPASILLSTYWMYKYTDFGNGYSDWKRVGSGGSLKAGEGFTMKGSNTDLSEQNYTFVGQPNNGGINLTISANNDYLIGNPYPSALDAKQFIKDNINQVVVTDPTDPAESGNGNRTVNIIDGNLYFWDHFGGGNHLLKSYEGGYAIFNLSGGVPAISNDLLTKNTKAISDKVAKRFIPVAQGFFVSSLEGGEIQFKNSQRIFKEKNGIVSQFMKSAKTSKSAKETNEDIFPRFHLNYSSPKAYHRQILVAFIENTTDGVDIGYDAINYENFAEDFSWKSSDVKLVIQAVPTLNDKRILPIEVKVATTGIIKINIDNAENIPEDTEIFIKDKITGKMHNISKTPFEIELTAGKYADRFAITFKTQKLVAEDVVAEILIPAATQPIIEGIHAFMNNAIKELQIKNNSTEEITNVTLINSLGQTVKTWNSNFNIRTISLPINTATGVYLVQIISKTGKTVKKISVE